MKINKPALADLALLWFLLGPSSIHGPSHWGRVADNGILLSKSTGADVDLVEAFALLHDVCRLSEFKDTNHGPLAAKLVDKIPRKILSLTREESKILKTAIKLHTVSDAKSDNITVQTCWDADRLDLVRVGHIVNPDLLYTEAAKLLCQR